MPELIFEIEDWDGNTIAKVKLMDISLSKALFTNLSIADEDSEDDRVIVRLQLEGLISYKSDILDIDKVSAEMNFE